MTFWQEWERQQLAKAAIKTYITQYATTLTREGATK